MQNLLAGPLWRRDAARIYTEAGGSKKDKGKKKERQKTGKKPPGLHSTSSNKLSSLLGSPEIEEDSPTRIRLLKNLNLSITG